MLFAVPGVFAHPVLRIWLPVRFLNIGYIPYSYSGRHFLIDGGRMSVQFGDKFII